MTDPTATRRFGSQQWLDNPNKPGMAMLYLIQECTRGAGGLAGTG